MGPLPKDIDGNEWVLNAVEVKHGVGAARASPGKSVVQLLPLLQQMVAEIRSLCGVTKEVLLRVHLTRSRQHMVLSAHLQSRSKAEYYETLLKTTGMTHPNRQLMQ